MSHLQYSPVGYSFNAADYCLDCIAEMFKYTFPRGLHDCAECVLDFAAKVASIADRHDESSFDSGDFPKAIPYHNDIHAECGPQGYGLDPDDPEVQGKDYCNATCARCGAVIDGTEQWDGTTFTVRCPAAVQRDEARQEREDAAEDARINAELMERAASEERGEW